jgi:hypothetical protein
LKQNITLPPSTKKRIHGRNTKVIALHPSTKEKYGRNIEVTTLPPSAQRETKGEAPSLYQREKMGETQRSSLALPQSKKIQVRNTKVITLLPSTIEKP